MADPNLVSIPKSVTPERIEQNFDVEHWQLSDESMEKLTALDSDFRYFISCAPAPRCAQPRRLPLLTAFARADLKKPDNDIKWHDGVVEKGDDSDRI